MTALSPSLAEITINEQKEREHPRTMKSGGWKAEKRVDDISGIRRAGDQTGTDLAR